MRRARFGSDGGEFLFNRRYDLTVDRIRKRAAVRFRGPPPQDVNADRAHQDRCEDETGNRQANANPHDWWCLPSHLSKKAKSMQSKCLHARLTWRGVRRVCAEPLILGKTRFLRKRFGQRHQPACKPGSVGHHPNSEWCVTAIPLGQCLHIASSNLPGRRARHRSRGVIASRRTARVAVPIRSCSRCGLPCPIRCRTRGALLPHLFTLAAPPFRVGKRFVLCGTFPGVAPAGRYPAPYVDGDRTFLSDSLSTVAGAAVRPTDVLVMGAQVGRVKEFQGDNAGLRPAKINYSEHVVLRSADSTGCRRSSQSKGVTEMQYLLMIYQNEADYAKIDAAASKKMLEEYGSFTQSIIQSGNFKAGDRLQPTTTATTVRVRDGKALTTDGPFAETREQLGGYYLVEAKDLDAAIAIAARIPGARFGSIEVRPIWVYN